VGGRKPLAVDVRIVAATHRDLDAAVAEGSFREDLLYRLRVVPVQIPPLRERRDDIPILAEHFVHRYAEDLATGPRFLSDAAHAKLVSYAWAGNVRELENAIKRALVLSTGDVLTPEDFDFLGTNTARAGSANLETLIRSEVESALASGDASVYRRLLERVERPLLTTVLEKTDGNQIRAAALLGINRNTLRKKIAELAIELPGRD
jgi:two-component system nitrogen regulation response regulator GlnG